MFSDSDIPKGGQLSKTKAMYVMYIKTYGTAPHFKFMVKEEISKSDVMTFHLKEVLVKLRRLVMDVIVLLYRERAKNESEDSRNQVSLVMQNARIF